MGMNSQIHISIATEDLNYLRREAESLEISVSELIRRKLSLPPVKEEILLLRRIKELFLEK